MKNIFFIITLLVSSAFCVAQESFYSWKQSCEALPLFSAYSLNKYATAIHKVDFLSEIEDFFATMDNQFDKIAWLDDIRPELIADQFQAHVEKVIIPDNSVVAIHGDMHGDIHSLNNFIQDYIDKGFLDPEDPFKIKNKDFYILFLGDYVDRGWYGAEVLYTVLRLKNQNPDNVFMVRGNHEDIDLNGHYGFSQEIESKFPAAQVLEKINQVYNLLPVALYLGAGIEGQYNFVQCCHGGIEMGFNPRLLLENNSMHAGLKLSELMQEDVCSSICCPEISYFKNYFKNNQKISSGNGFMWSDFIVAPNSFLKLSPRDGFAGSIFEYGEIVAKKLLASWSTESCQLRSIFRAHQHSGEMKNRILNLDFLSHQDDTGLGKLCIQDSIHKFMPGLLTNIPVVTFSVAPHTGYGWPIHSYAQLYVAKEYKDWRLRAVNKLLL